MTTIAKSTPRNRRAASALAIPDRTNLVLGAVAVALLIVYVGLMASTIFFATWQTQLTRGIMDTRSRILVLETQYYAAIAKIDSTDPSSLGLVAPANVDYVVAKRAPSLTRAD